MGKTFEMKVDSTAAIRIDVAMHPPFLPIEIDVRKKRASGKLEAPIASAEWTENRLLLMNSDLPRGTYIVEIRQPRKYKVTSDLVGEEDLSNFCSHVTISA